MEQRRQTRSGMTQRFDRTHAVLEHFAWRGRARMKFARVRSALLNPVLLDSSARQHQYRRKDQERAHLHLNVQREQPILGLHRKGFMLTTRAQSSLLLAYLDSTHQQFKQINVSYWHLFRCTIRLTEVRLTKHSFVALFPGYECPPGTSCSE